MTTIGPLSPLLAQLQAQAASWARQRKATLVERPRSAPFAEQEPLDFAANLAREVRAIPVDDPHRRRKAFRAYLQLVLAREGAIGRLDDPELLELAARVQDAMEHDDTLRAAILQAGEELLRGIR